MGLIRALLDFHPKGSEKSKGMVGIKVQKSSHGDSRCFYMVKNDGQEEDFSAQKCLSAIEANPPYVEPDSKDKKVVAKQDTEAKPAVESAADAKVVDAGAEESNKVEAR